MDMARTELLSSIPLFESLADDDLETLAGHLDECRFEAGQVIFREGDPGKTLYVIEDGAVEISSGDGRNAVELATLYSGEYFGELSLFDGLPRSANATASRNSTILALGHADFVDFVKRDPAAGLLIMAEMGKRLRHTNELMSRAVSRNINEIAEERLTFGQRIADRVATFGGSWPFIFVFAAVMFVWMTINVLHVMDFDPYPFILLNLALSTIAAIQAPIIMMSQNRQAAKDKLLAENDYKVNLKAELGIEALLKSNDEILARLALVEGALNHRTRSEGHDALLPSSGGGGRQATG